MKPHALCKFSNYSRNTAKRFVSTSYFICINLNTAVPCFEHNLAFKWPNKRKCYCYRNRNTCMFSWALENYSVWCAVHLKLSECWKFYRDSRITYLFLFVLIWQLTHSMTVVFTFVLTGARGICIQNCFCYAEIWSGKYYSKSQFEYQWL